MLPGLRASSPKSGGHVETVLNRQDCGGSPGPLPRSLARSRGRSPPPGVSPPFPVLRLFLARLCSELALQTGGCVQGNVIKYAFAPCSAPSLPGSPLPHPGGGSPLNPPPHVSHGPSAGSRAQHGSRHRKPPPAAEGAPGEHCAPAPAPLCSLGQPGSLAPPAGKLLRLLSSNLLRGRPHDRFSWDLGLKCSDQMTPVGSPDAPSAVCLCEGFAVRHFVLRGRRV